jgi:EAL domain-containing protein (putative c-di-GMP-specific phosphodiesterase class I)
VVGRLRALGVLLSLDDFGTGYSSLSYLKHFAIDRAFVQGIPGPAGEGALAAAIVAMGRSLGMKLVGDGVETAEQLAFLQACDCQVMQGFYFSAPLACGAMTELLNRTLKNGEALRSELRVLEPAPGSPAPAR